jgi:hypothetical protein
MVSSELCCDSPNASDRYGYSFNGILYCALLVYCSLPMGAIDTGSHCFLYSHECRTRLRQYVAVIDYHEISREVVALAMNYTDRYLQVHEHDPQDPQEEEALPSGSAYQLIVMAGLFLAIKMSTGHYFGETVNARTMCAMSRGMFTLEQLLSMETQLLVTLGWRVHPPSPRVFLNHYLSILTNYSGHDQYLLMALSQVDKKQLHEVRNEADFMLEHAVLDYHFCGHYPSVIAIAALCNATFMMWPAHVGNPMTLLEDILGHGWDDSQVTDCRQRLYDLMVTYHSHQDPGQRRLEQSPEDAAQRIRSPVSVVYPTTTATKTSSSDKTMVITPSLYSSTIAPPTLFSS